MHTIRSKFAAATLLILSFNLLPFQRHILAQENTQRELNMWKDDSSPLLEKRSHAQEQETRDHQLTNVAPWNDSGSLSSSETITPAVFSDTAVPLSDSNTVPFAESFSSSPDEFLQSNYILGPGDRVETRILGYEAYDWSLTERVILSDGTMRFPFVGTVVAAGKTLDALEVELTNQLKSYLTVPEVDMYLTTLRPVVVNVAGEVYRPGPVPLGSLTQAETSISGSGSVTTSTTTPNLASALAAAGGIQRTADIREVRVTRQTASGAERTFTINLWDALQGSTDLGGLVMFDGDVVYVPRAASSAGLDEALVASSSIAPTNVRVRVIGEVVRPGEVEVQPNSSISSAVAAAGGPDTLSAQLNEVRLIRLSETGQVEEQQVDLSQLVDDYQIQDGDVIFVPKRGYLTTIDSISRVLTPLLSPLNILNLFNLFN